MFKNPNRRLAAAVVFLLITTAGCVPQPIVTETAPITQVLTTLDLELISTVPYLCESDPDCDFFVTLIDGDYDQNIVEALYTDFGARIVPANCRSFEWKDDPHNNLSFDEWIRNPDGIGLYSIEYEPAYRVDSIVVDLKTAATRTNGSEDGVVLGDMAEILKLSGGRTTSRKTVITDQRKVTLKPKKTSDMIGKYYSVYETIYEYEKNGTYGELGPLYKDYLFTPKRLGTEIICALQTYLANDYLLTQSELELVFAFQFVNTATDKSGVELKIAILTVSGKETNETIDDRTQTMTIKIKATESADISDATSIVQALNTRLQSTNRQGLDNISLGRFGRAFVGNVPKTVARTAIQPYLWDAFLVAVKSYFSNRDRELPACATTSGSWPFCASDN